MREPVEQFRDAIQSAGLPAPPVIEPDGKLHRFPTNARRSDDAGWYVFRDGQIPAGAFGDWRTDTSETWRADIGRRLSPDEEAEHRIRVDSMWRAREAEDARRAAAAREKAAAIWQAASVPSMVHPYLLAKAVGAQGLREHKGT